MALAIRTPFSLVKAEKTATETPEISPAAKGKLVLQPRFCTLRAFGGDRGGVIKSRNVDNYQVSRFFQALSDYIDSSRKSQDFEIIFGRFAMIVFSATLTTELATGSSVFKKMDLIGIAEAGGVCLAAVACSAVFAFFQAIAAAWVNSSRLAATPLSIRSLIKSSMACSTIPANEDAKHITVVLLG